MDSCGDALMRQVLCTKLTPIKAALCNSKRQACSCDVWDLHTFLNFQLLLLFSLAVMEFRIVQRKQIFVVFVVEITLHAPIVKEFSGLVLLTMEHVVRFCANFELNHMK